MFGFANAISCARLTARGQCGHVGVVNTRMSIGWPDGLDLCAVVGGEDRSGPADQQDRLHERDELVSRRRAEEPDPGILDGLPSSFISDGNRRHPVDPVLRRTVAIEDEIHFLDGDLVGQRRQLVQDLPRLEAGLTAERLREKQQPHGPFHFRKRFAEAFLVCGRNERHTGLCRDWRLEARG